MERTERIAPTGEGSEDATLIRAPSLLVYSIGSSRHQSSRDAPPPPTTIHSFPRHFIKAIDGSSPVKVAGLVTPSTPPHLSMLV